MQIALIQAVWRGYSQRKRDGKARVEARKRLEAAAAAAARNPAKTLGARVKDALEQLVCGRKDPAQVSLLLGLYICAAHLL